jgi:hypothetical protein
MFIVTCTDEHSHPPPTHKNYLAGSTRHKSLSPQIVTIENSSQPFAKQVSPLVVQMVEKSFQQ